jgi:hypothetical protein
MGTSPANARAEVKLEVKATSRFAQFGIAAECAKAIGSEARFICLGEDHTLPSCRAILIENLAKWRAAGLTHLGLEVPSGVTEGATIEQTVAEINQTTSLHPNELPLGLVWKAARACGVTVCFYDYDPPVKYGKVPKPHETLQNAPFVELAQKHLAEFLTDGRKAHLKRNPLNFHNNGKWVRCGLMNRYAAERLRALNPNKCLVLVGADHLAGGSVSLKDDDVKVGGKPKAPVTTDGKEEVRSYESLQALLGGGTIALNASSADGQVKRLA